MTRFEEEQIKFKRAKKKYYTCQFCEQKRETSDKTDLCYRGFWYKGCQNCMLKLVEDPKKFNNIEFNI